MSWLIVSMVTVILLLAQAGLTTFVLMVALNGYPSIPDAMVNTYLTCACGSIPSLAFLSGWAAKKVSEKTKIPAGLAGIGFAGLAILLLPAILAGVTFALLAGFGLLQF